MCILSEHPELTGVFEMMLFCKQEKSADWQILLFVLGLSNQRRHRQTSVLLTLHRSEKLSICTYLFCVVQHKQ